MYFYISKFLTPLILPVNLLVICLVLSFFIKKLKKYNYFFLIFLFLISIFPTGDLLENFFLKTNRYYGKNINNFDSILILGGSEDRILHGLYLSKLNPESKIIFSGGSSLVFFNKKYFSLDEKSRFEKISKELISENRLVTISRSRNTIENLKEFKKINKKHNFKKTIVVTHPNHYKRVFLISKKIDLNLVPYLWPREEEFNNVFHYYQKIDIGKNLLKFNAFFKEIYGILAIMIFSL